MLNFEDAVLTACGAKNVTLDMLWTLNRLDTILVLKRFILMYNDDRPICVGFADSINLCKDITCNKRHWNTSDRYWLFDGTYPIGEITNMHTDQMRGIIYRIYFIIFKREFIGMITEWDYDYDAESGWDLRG